MTDRLDFEIDVELETGLITGHAGVPGLIEAFRQTGTAAVIEREIRLKSRKRGLSASEMVESLLAMWAAGGERAEDLDQFRQDQALVLLLGHDLPAAQTARDFLAQFHGEDLPLLQEGKSSVPTESAPLLGLAKANAELVLDLQCRHPVKTATLDIDATVIACDKRAAKRAYDGNRGYQPVLALWAEQDVIVVDEFRDGNVPAGSGNRRVVEKAIAALPGGLDKIYLRGDSALYQPRAKGGETNTRGHSGRRQQHSPIFQERRIGRAHAGDLHHVIQDREPDKAVVFRPPCLRLHRLERLAGIRTLEP